MPAIPASPTPRRHDTRSAGHGHARRVVVGLLLAVGAVLITDAVFGDRGLIVLMRTQRDVAALEADIARAEAENQRLRDEVERFKNDPTAIEGLARKELGLIRPGEKLFIIRDVPAPSSPDTH
jgi:cell division protein FtsB